MGQRTTAGAHRYEARRGGHGGVSADTGADGPTPRTGTIETEASGDVLQGRAATCEAETLRAIAQRGRVSDHERRATYGTICAITVAALVDALDPDAPEAASSSALLEFVAAATAERLTVLLEPIPARDAHPVVTALARTGLIGAGVAQRAHLLIDLRRDPG